MYHRRFPALVVVAFYKLRNTMKNKVPYKE